MTEYFIYSFIYLAAAVIAVPNYASKYAGADYVVIETYYSAVELGAQALIDLGFSLKKPNRRNS
jgi:hypothetical protein